MWYRLAIAGIVIAALVVFALFYQAPHKGGVSTSTATYFAEVDKSGTVLRVIVASQEFIDSGVVGDPSAWVQTDINGGIRKNYAGKGYVYDKDLDAFVPPKGDANDTFDTNTARWKSGSKQTNATST